MVEVRPIIRTSDRGNFKRCRQKWFWESKLRGNLESNRGNRAMSFGTAIHSGLEAYYHPDTWHTDAHRKLLLAKIAFYTKWQESRPENVEDRDEWSADADLGMAMLKGYVEEYQHEGFTPTHVEIEFEVPILCPTHLINSLPKNFYSDITPAVVANHLYYKGQPVMYQGRIDAIWQDEDGRYWIVDHKTAKKFDDTEWLALDEQCGSYMWAIQQMLGIKIAGVIYNELRKDAPHEPAILKPTKKEPGVRLSKDKSQNTTDVIYRATLAKHGLSGVGYEDILTHLREQGNKFFRRTQVHRSQRELQTQGERIFIEAVDMLNDPAIYTNPTKFNCTGCPFFTACIVKQEGGDYSWIIKDQFHTRESSN